MNPQVRYILPWLIVVFIWIPPLPAQAPGEDIRKKQSELQNIRDQINEFEDQIKQQSRSEKATLEILDSYDRKSILVRRLVAKLRAEEKNLQAKVEGTRTQLRKLQDQLAFLKQHYAGYVKSAYRAGQASDVELLLTAGSVNQFYVRAEYLRRFTNQRRLDADRIITKKREVEEKQAQLQEQLSEERRVLAEKGAEEDRLAASVAERKEVLQRIRRDKKSIQREIERKLEAARQLESLITNLIEADRLKSEKSRTKEGQLPQPPPAGGAFESRKGKLRWPVAEGSVIAGFGQQRHPTLKTITQNTGIDIAVRSGTSVTSVADGEVTTIWWLPGYGNLVIVDHSGGFRTVYAHLSEIHVGEGQRVKEGEILGASGEAVEGPRLHFELWRGRDKQNPELWLSRQ